jgi:thioredoxin-related protein
MYYILALFSAFLNLAEPDAKVSEAETIEWMTIEEAQLAQQKEPRKIFIDVYTDWCGWCKRMDKATFQNAEIAAYMNTNYYNVKFNAEQKDSIVFNGQTFKYVAQGRRGYHELAAALMNGKMSYPTVVFLDENLSILSPIPGFQAPAAFEPIMTFFGSNAYKETKWETYRQNFESNLKTAQK